MYSLAKGNTISVRVYIRRIHIFLIWITSRVDLTVSDSPSVWPCKSSMSLDIRFGFLSFWFSASFLSECSMPIRRPTSLKLFHIFEDFVYHYPSMYNMAVQKRKFCSHPFTWLIKVFKKCIQKVKFFGWVLDLAKRPQSFFTLLFITHTTCIPAISILKRIDFPFPSVNMNFRREN